MWEGSTRLWAAHKDAMRQALELHDAVIGESVQKAGGRVFKQTGDGVCAEFSSTIKAVAAAAAAQRLLGLTDWRPLESLRVRMAVHVGEAERRGDDWTGLALSRTARLMERPRRSDPAVGRHVRVGGRGSWC